MIYTVYTGKKLKGCWTDKDQAIAYMANRVKEEREVWKLVEINDDKCLSKEVEKASEELVKERSKGKAHNLKAQNIEASSDGKTIN